ncbi:winged helix-turn-helix domain-containing protein [Halobium salinum]|uniref:Winged helix-turn-helix domain-containing protein n=1 Tax=Halobium salinum TaxID=1364940 RepID=A0ABD5PCH1_9EURY|nr:winged helix-turn-helix domain-containing protein [Halobium salinum]
MDSSTPADAADPAEAFAALSDPTRVAILQALWDADGRELPFSELRSAVGVDDSGRFNYHVGKLTNRFVRKTDDGYKLRLAGIQVIGAVLSGSVTQDGHADPLPFGESCPLCGGQMTFRYEDERVKITCDDCGHWTMEWRIPPGVFAAHDHEVYPAVAERYMRALVVRADDGFCSVCEGPIVPSLSSARGAGFDDQRFEGVPFVEYACDRCGQTITADLGAALHRRPPVAGFYHDRGVDLRETSLLDFAAVDERARFVTEDPRRAAVTYRVDGDELTLVVDESLSVVGSEITGR